MANPSPQPTPTSGVGTAVKIALSASTEALTTIVAAREYSVTLSLSATGHAATTTLTATVQDVAGTTFTSGNSNVVKFKSYNNPSNGSPAWHRTSNFSGYSDDVASVGLTSGVITALAVGQAVIEAYFPTFDTTDGTDLIFTQVLVNVIP